MILPDHGEQEWGKPKSPRVSSTEYTGSFLPFKGGSRLQPQSPVINVIHLSLLHIFTVAYKTMI